MCAAKLNSANPSEKLRNMLKIQTKVAERLFRLEYNNNAENSHKFYESWIEVDKTTGLLSLIAKWGRIGCSLQAKVYSSGSRNSCEIQAFRLQLEKRRKGYTKVS